MYYIDTHHQQCNGAQATNMSMILKLLSEGLLKYNHAEKYVFIFAHLI